MFTTTKHFFLLDSDHLQCGSQFLWGNNLNTFYCFSDSIFWFSGRRPPEEERFRDLPHPVDRWRRSPSPHRELPDRFPPDRPREWERDGRRGPDDR